MLVDSVRDKGSILLLLLLLLCAVVEEMSGLNGLRPPSSGEGGKRVFAAIRSELIFCSLFYCIIAVSVYLDYLGVNTIEWSQSNWSNHKNINHGGPALGFA